MNLHKITLVAFAPPQTHTQTHKLCCGGKNTTTHHTPPFRGCVCVVVSKQQNVNLVKFTSWARQFKAMRSIGKKLRVVATRKFLHIGAS